MPAITLTESAVWEPIIQTPDDGDGATRASIETTFNQRLTNRTLYLKTLTETTGVKRLRIVSGGVADIQALAGYSNNDTVFSPTLGLYTFAAASGVAEDIPHVIAAAGGRWFSDKFDVAGDAVGASDPTFATLYRSGLNLGKVVQPVPYRHFDRQSTKFEVPTDDSDSAIANTTSVVYVNPATPIQVTLSNIIAGDLIRIHAHVRLYSTATPAFAKLELLDGALTINLQECWARVSNEDRLVSWSTAYTAPAGIPRTVVIRMIYRTTDAAKSVAFYKPASIVADVLRP